MYKKILSWIHFMKCRSNSSNKAEQPMFEDETVIKIEV